jgi:LPXTG-motif cell wall-anchored protein
VRRRPNPLARLGLALSAAVLGLAMASAAAVADPADPAAPAATETGEPTGTTVPAPPTESTESTAPTEPDAPVDAQPQAEDATTQSVQDIQATATFGKPSYNTGEKMTITLTVKNAGTTPVSLNAHFFSSQPDAIGVNFPSPFEEGTFTLAAGASVTHDLTSAMGNPDVGTAKLYAWFSDATSGTAQLFTFSVPIKQTFGHASGTVYVDENANGKYDTGEGRGGVELTWRNQLHEGATFTATSDSTGRFAIDKLPTSPYFVDGSGQDGLKVGYRQVVVDESGVDGLLFRAVGPLVGLAVDLEFAKDTYARDEAPVVRVTLNNSTDDPLIGIVANCDRGGFGTSLDGRGPGWGDLAGEGVTVAPHTALVLQVTEPMPADAYEYGFVSVGCDFSYKNVDDFDHNPHDFDRAAVPGQRGDLEGVLADDDTGIAGVRLVLVPDGGGCAVAEATTGADGRFAFHQVPVGDYDLYVFPPAGWHVEYDNPTSTSVVGRSTGQMYIELAPGAATAPTLPSCPAAPQAPAPQGRTAPVDGLPDTGASIAAPVLVGALALLAGTGAVLVTRRRRPLEKD